MPADAPINIQPDSEELTDEQKTLVESGEIARPATPEEIAAAEKIEVDPQTADLTLGLEDGELLVAVDSWDTDIVRDHELEAKVLNDDYGQGMAYEDFVKEWNHVYGLDGTSPSQADYENWIQWGTKGLLAAQGAGERTADLDVNVKNLLVNLGYDESQLSSIDGITASWFKEEDLQYLTDNDIAFDPTIDNEYVIVPEGTKMATDRYTEVLSLEGFTMMQKNEKTEWYEEEWMTYAMIAASVALAFTGVGGIMAGAIAGALTTTVGATAASIIGAATASAAIGGVTAGGIQETLGGDFADGLEDGAIKGGITGGISAGLAGVSGISEGASNIVIGGGDAIANLATGAELEDALVSGAATAVGSQVGGETDSLVLESLISSSDTLIGGGSTEEFLIGAGTSFAHSLGNKTAAQRDEENTNKVKDAANRSRGQSVQAV